MHTKQCESENKRRVRNVSTSVLRVRRRATNQRPLKRGRSLRMQWQKKERESCLDMCKESLCVSSDCCCPKFD